MLLSSQLTRVQICLCPGTTRKPRRVEQHLVQDDIYSFFMNCYHLKDWIRNDPSGSSIAGKVEGYINTTPELSLCADICNGLKHLTLTTHRSGEKPEFGPRKFEVGIGAEPTTIAAHYTINTDSGPIDAFSLATKCLEAWEKLLA